MIERYSKSYPYLASSLRTGAAYGKVLAHADKLDYGYPRMDKLRGESGLTADQAVDVEVTWNNEQQRRQEALELERKTRTDHGFVPGYIR